MVIFVGCRIDCTPLEVCGSLRFWVLRERLDLGCACGGLWVRARGFWCTDVASLPLCQDHFGIKTTLEKPRRRTAQ